MYPKEIYRTVSSTWPAPQLDAEQEAAVLATAAATLSTEKAQYWMDPDIVTAVRSARTLDELLELARLTTLEGQLRLVDVAAPTDLDLDLRAAVLDAVAAHTPDGATLVVADTLGSSSESVYGFLAEGGRLYFAEVEGTAFRICAVRAEQGVLDPQEDEVAGEQEIALARALEGLAEALARTDRAFPLVTQMFPD